MKALLFLVGLVFAVAGIATGVVSQMDYGNALIGFNLGLAATLLVGGFIIMGLASINEAIARLAEDLSASTMAPISTTTNIPAPAVQVAKKDSKDDLPFPAATAAVGAVGVAAGATGLDIKSQLDDASGGVDKAIDKVAEAAKEAQKEAAEVKQKETAEAAQKAQKEATEAKQKEAAEAKQKEAAEAKQKEAAEAAQKEAASKASDVASETTGQVTGDVADKVTDTAGGAAIAVVDADHEIDEEADEAQEADDAIDEGDSDQLYIVEELIIRGKPARVLSDNTVEAETAEGWMRFENIEHLEEYLDAMEG